MPEWIHNRAEHLLAKNPDMSKSTAFAIATQQSHALGKSPKGYGTAEGKHEAKVKYDTPKDDVKKANPGSLDSPKLAGFALPPLQYGMDAEELAAAVTFRRALAQQMMGKEAGVAGRVASWVSQLGRKAPAAAAAAEHAAPSQWAHVADVLGQSAKRARQAEHPVANMPSQAAGFIGKLRNKIRGIASGTEGVGAKVRGVAGEVERGAGEIGEELGKVKGDLEGVVGPFRPAQEYLGPLQHAMAAGRVPEAEQGLGRYWQLLTGSRAAKMKEKMAPIEQSLKAVKGEQAGGWNKFVADATKDPGLAMENLPGALKAHAEDILLQKAHQIPLAPMRQAAEQEARDVMATRLLTGGGLGAAAIGANLWGKPRPPAPAMSSNPNEYDYSPMVRTASVKLADMIPGGKGDNKKDSDFDKGQVRMGKKVEREHTTDPRKADEITHDHLEEIPDYYARLKKMEKAAPKRKEAGLKLADGDEEGGRVPTDADRKAIEKFIMSRPGLKDEDFHEFLEGRGIKVPLGEAAAYALARRQGKSKQAMSQDPYLLDQVGKPKIRKMEAEAPDAKYRVKHAFATSQYSGEIGPYPGPPQDKFLPPFRVPQLKTAGPPSEVTSEGKKMASMREELEKLNSFSPKTQLTSSQKEGMPKTTAPPGPSIADIAKPVGYGMPLAGATKSGTV